ncbi:transporter [Streptomyces bambusae]|uniref:transporter n=1 Tax=Streptomyces bambusae TaxID=1550616 RepID=UPI001CFC7687|nr:transporter [Streptomyces bambusae]MCB5167598.1 transporter [Streptomyces bambusae]
MSALTTAEITPVFVRLKLSLLRNGLKQSSKRRAAFLASLVFTVLFGLLQLLGLVLLRGNAQAGTVTVLLAGVLALGWAVMPLFFSSGDETLDPSRLVMLPLRPRPLIVALLVSSLVGIGPFFTLCLAVGSVVAVAQGPAGIAVGVLAVPLLMAGCVALARALATANVRLLSSRKGRDLAVLSGLGIAVGAQLVNFGWQRLARDGGLDALEPAAAVVRWLPPATAIGAVDSAGRGAYGTAAVQLLLTVLGVAGLLWAWQRSLTKLMVSPDGSTIAAAEEARTARERQDTGWARLLPGGRSGAAMHRTLRYVWRDPKTKAAWVTSLAVGAIVPVFNALQGTGSVYLACMGAGMLGVQMYNQFGQDTSAFWMVAQTISTPRDAYVELRARALALAVVTVPYTVAVSVLTAALVGNWPALPETMGLSLGLLGGMLCTGAVASARFPYSIPQDGAFKNVAPGQGGLAWMSIFLGALVSAALCGPLIGLTVFLHVSSGPLWTVLPVGVGWGVLIAWAGLRVSAPQVARRLPEILTAVSKG